MIISSALNQTAEEMTISAGAWHTFMTRLTHSLHLSLLKRTVATLYKFTKTIQQ